MIKEDLKLSLRIPRSLHKQVSNISDKEGAALIN